MKRRLRQVRIDAAVYRMVQRALPRDFRRQFGADMQNLFLVQRRQAMRNGTLWRFRASVLADALRHGIAMRLTDRKDRPPSFERERRMTLSTEGPAAVRRSECARPLRDDRGQFGSTRTAMPVRRPSSNTGGRFHSRQPRCGPLCSIPVSSRPATPEWMVASDEPTHPG
jgi:hypothetical protein